MSLFLCPLCKSTLIPDTKTWRCDGSENPKKTFHSFDVARQGYINLLPVQQKKSKAPGDSEDSIQARKRFLAAGCYAPLQQALVAIVAGLVDEDIKKSDAKRPINWLDIGCGEGYYSQALAKLNLDNLIAADISKPALIELAKKGKSANKLWYQQKEDKKTAIFPMVASAAQLPIKPNTLFGISSIFSPILPKAFFELLKKDGYLVIAKPDQGHLASVRQALFEDVREHDSDKFLQELAPYFELIERFEVAANLELSPDALADLLTMTPYSYRAKIERRQNLLTLATNSAFVTQARFVIFVLKKTAAN
ncbi:putative RNA methyltransferase [Psychrobacter ciconiae]|uniref:putative RNA methyltransferase n=1 Tax=Psychrobacter ciconiae TaxID=1553449 RepID=UPI0019184186|nr:methyltransferase domain-containing protein [Psychrobacter ciconiae]